MTPCGRTISLINGLLVALAIPAVAAHLGNFNHLMIGGTAIGLADFPLVPATPGLTFFG